MGTHIDWLFPVHVQEAGPNGHWTVVCHLPGADLVQARSQLALACEFFFALVRQGGFRGAGEDPGPDTVLVPPLLTVAIDREEVIAQGHCGHFDALGVGVLVNLVERLLPETAGLSITLPFDFDALRLVPGIYPSAPKGLLFAVMDEARDGNLEVQIEFCEAVEFEQRARIEEALSDWWCAAGLGAFRDADQRALDSDVVPPQAPEWGERSLNFTLEKVRANDAIIDVLVGMVAWINLRVAAVVSVEVI